MRSRVPPARLIRGPGSSSRSAAATLSFCSCPLRELQQIGLNNYEHDSEICCIVGIHGTIAIL